METIIIKSCSCGRTVKFRKETDDQGGIGLQAIENGYIRRCRVGNRPKKWKPAEPTYVHCTCERKHKLSTFKEQGK